MGPELRDFRHGLPEWDLRYEIPATGRRSCSNRRQKAHDDKSVVVATGGRVSPRQWNRRDIARDGEVKVRAESFTGCAVFRKKAGSGTIVAEANCGAIPAAPQR